MTRPLPDAPIVVSLAEWTQVAKLVRLAEPYETGVMGQLRLTADGKIRPCLGQHGEIDLREALRNQTQDAEELLRQALANKPRDHDFTRGYEPARPMTALGG